MKKFVYEYTTKVYFGEGVAKEQLASAVSGYGEKVMLAYGGGSVKKNGIYDEVKNILADAGKEVFDFSGIMSNPTYAKVQEGAKLAKENKIDFILAVGGGSVIDCCKIVAAQAKTEKDLWEMEMTDHQFPTDVLPMGGNCYSLRNRSGNERRCGHYQRREGDQSGDGSGSAQICNPRSFIHCVRSENAGDFRGV